MEHEETKRRRDAHREGKTLCLRAFVFSLNFKIKLS